MKKLIVLSVVFALVATAAFAVDIGANVFGLVVPAQGESGTGASDDITSSIGFQRTRLSGYGEAGDGAFGGQIRVDFASLGIDMKDPTKPGLNGPSMKDAFAFWKPIDQLKVVIGGNTDGWYGKEGVTGWGFHGNPYDAGVAFVGGNVWGWGPYNKGDIKYRDAFFGGYGAGTALQLNITPVEMFALNVAIPFGGKTEDAVKDIFVQADVNLDFGNIAVSFQAADDDKSQVWVYYGGSFGDLGLDIGFSYNMDDTKQPIGVGAGLKYATDAFGVKFRIVANLGNDDLGTNILTEVLPYFSLGDNMAAFVGIGICMLDGDLDWHFNPYLRIGEEWGAQFLVGVQVYSTGAGDKTNWNIPIAIMVNF
jgi:hypothetical protein